MLNYYVLQSVYNEMIVLNNLQAEYLRWEAEENVRKDNRDKLFA